jgi:hypothetical protein
MHDVIFKKNLFNDVNKISWSPMNTDGRLGVQGRAGAYFDGFITQRRLVPYNRRSILLSSTSLFDLVLHNRIV